MLGLVTSPASAQQSVIPATRSSVITGTGAGSQTKPTTPGPSPCSSTPSQFLVPNDNSASFVYVTYTTTGSPTAINLTIQASSTGTSNFFQISDTATDPVSGQITAQGYFPLTNVFVTCTGGSSPTITIAASRTSSSGSQMFAQLDSGVYQKVIASGAPASVNITTTLDTPYGNSAGWIVVQSPSGTFVGATTVTVSYSDQCNNASPINSFTLAGSFSIVAGNTVPQAFAVPSFPTCAVTVAFNHGSSIAGTVSIEYNFLKPGAAFVPFQVLRISTAATTTVKSGPGSVHAVAVNTPVASETIKVYDVAAANCTGTPSALSLRAGITLSATSDIPQVLPYDMQFTLGICVVTSGAADLSIIFD